MKKSNPLERISEALGGEQGLRALRNLFGIPNFCYKSPIGWIDIVAEDNGVLHVSFSEVDPFPEPTFQSATPVILQLTELLNRYFEGERVDFSEVPVQVAFRTDFQQQVWNAIREIPYGEVRTYKWIADRIGRPKSVRSVGNATGANPLPILIPCHRVVGSNGKLGGYSGGIERKRQLLTLEGYPVAALK